MNSPQTSTTNITRKKNLEFRSNKNKNKNKNNDPLPLNKNKKKVKVRRGALTYKNVQGIRGKFQKPPRPPRRSRSPPPFEPEISFGGPLYANNNEDPVNPEKNISRLSASEMDAYIRRLRMD